MFWRKQTSLSDRLHSHGVLDHNGKGYHVRKDGAISIMWKIDSGNFLRFTPGHFEQYARQFSKTIGLLPDHSQVEFLYDKYESRWAHLAQPPLSTLRPEIAKLMEIRNREIGVRPYFTCDIYLIVTFNHLIDYQAPARLDFFNFNLKRSNGMAQQKFVQDIRLIENIASTVESELRCFNFARLHGEGITELLRVYYNLSPKPAEASIREASFNSDLVYKNYARGQDDLRIGMDHVLVASMIELPDRAVNPIEVDKRFLKSPLDYFLGLPFPLRFSVRFEKLPRDKAISFINRNKIINKPRFNALAEMKMVELEGDTNGETFPGIANLIEFDKDFLANIAVTLISWHSERQTLAERQERMISSFTRFFNSRGMIEVGQDAMNVFLSCAPGNFPYRRMTIRGAHLGHFINISSHYQGMNTGVPLINTNDAPVTYDLFSTANDNYNSLIVGPSGKGKSFFCNALIFNYIALGVPVIILDLSGSYKPLSNVLRSDYIEIDRSNPNYLDPFHYFRPNEYDHDSPEYLDTITYLQSFVNLMIREEGAGQHLSKDKKAIIYESLDEFFQSCSSGECNMFAFWHFVRQSGKQFFRHNSQFHNYVVNTLGYYLEKSALKVYFNPQNRNKLNISMESGFDLLVFDLKGIERELELMPLYSNLLSMLVMDALHRDFSKFLFILDESWKALENSEIIYGLVKEAGRTSRKHFGAIAALTQNIEDLKQGDLGSSVLTNSFSKFLLAHGGEDVEKAIQVLDMTKAEQRAFRNLQKHEILLCRQGEPIIFRIPFSSYDYWTWTTQPDEVAKRNQRLKREPTVMSAISALAEKE